MVADEVVRSLFAGYISDIQAALPADDEFFLSETALPVDGNAEWGDVTEPTDTWYTGATAVVTYADVQNDPDGDDKVLIRTNQFQYDWTAAGGAGAQTIRAYGVTNAARNALKFYRNLDTPRVLANTLDSIVVEAVVPFPYPDE